MDLRLSLLLTVSIAAHGIAMLFSAGTTTPVAAFTPGVVTVRLQPAPEDPIPPVEPEPETDLEEKPEPEPDPPPEAEQPEPPPEPVPVAPPADRDDVEPEREVPDVDAETEPIADDQTASAETSPVAPREPRKTVRTTRPAPPPVEWIVDRRDPEPTPRRRSKRRSPDATRAPNVSRASARSSGAVVAPRPLPRNREPAYPTRERRRGIGGTVELELRVANDGRVERATVARSSGCRALDRAALSAARRWRYEPARRGGVAVSYLLRVPIVFEPVLRRR